MAAWYDQGQNAEMEDAQPPQDDEPDDNEEQSILEFARFHMLSIDYASESPFAGALSEPDGSGVHEIWTDLPDNATSQDVFEDLTKERLGISPKALELLKQSCRIPAEYPIICPPSPPRASQLKEELPLLPSDNEYDLKHFGRRVTRDFRRVNLPPEPVDEEKDEGLSWPTRYYALPAECDAKARHEKLEIPRDVMHFLQEAIRNPMTTSESEQVLDIELPTKKRHFPHLITPPLLPLSPPPKPFVDPVPRGELQPLSDITDPSIEQQRQLEQKLAEDDSIVSINSDPMLFDVSEVEQLYSPLRSDAQPDSPTSAKRKIVDLRVEGPLTPPLPTELPHKRIKTVLFPELLHEVIPDLPSTYVAEEDLLCSSGSFDDFFNENIAPLAEQVNQAVENEQLIEADATKRVQVPSIATVKLVPPWLEFASRSESRDGGFDAQFELLRGVKKDCMAHVQSWHGNSKAERQLSWLPFPPELGNVELSERINVGAVLDQLLRDIDSSEIVDSSAMVWRPEGLRILDDTWDDEDDGLEPRDFDIEELQLSDVLRRKTHDFKDRKDALTDPKEHRSDVAVSRMPSRFDDGTLFGDAFSASIALDKFLAGRAVPPTVVNQQRDIASSARRLSARLAVQEASQHNSKAHEHPLEVAPLSTTPAFVPPGIPNDLPSRPFIISSSILKSSRELYRTICTFYPNAEFIERDFASLRRSRDQHGSSDEGDIILSPSIGLIFTTLQKIKQRALPGQISNYYGIKERILTVSQRFERLIVFVSNDTTSSKVDERDCMAIAELSGFAAGLDAEVQICCIPSAETTLAQWVGSAMQRHGVDPEKGEMKLLQDETLWEQFLRRAGLNAFAAQVVLTELKPPVSPEGISSDSVVVPDYDASLYGIASFVRMKGEERVKRFAEALGGRRILERVSGVLDLRWKTSAGA